MKMKTTIPKNIWLYVWNKPSKTSSEETLQKNQTNLKLDGKIQNVKEMFKRREKT